MLYWSHRDMLDTITGAQKRVLCPPRWPNGRFVCVSFCAAPVTQIAWREWENDWWQTNRRRMSHNAVKGSLRHYPGTCTEAVRNATEASVKQDNQGASRDANCTHPAYVCRTLTSGQVFRLEISFSPSKGRNFAASRGWLLCSEPETYSHTELYRVAQKSHTIISWFMFWWFSALKMEVINSSVTSVHIRTWRLCIP
jgi:hypothetical protein